MFSVTPWLSMASAKKNSKTVAIQQTNFLEKLLTEASEEIALDILPEPLPEDGFEVLSCTSSNAFVSLQGDVAIFIHDVATELRMQGEQHFSQERETIVFRRQQQGLWLACHEHLSAMPEGLPPP